MRILLFGSTGLLGSVLTRKLQDDFDLIAMHSLGCDLRDSEALSATISDVSPDFIINAAGYTLVDRAEEEQEKAWAVNAVAPGMMARAAAHRGIPFLHYSTDYVFDGHINRAYHERDLPNPLNFYGKSKLEGERRIREETDLYLTLRTGWLYSDSRPCFVTRVIALARVQPIVRMTTDQTGSPTWVDALADASTDLIRRSRLDPVGWMQAHAGLYHLAGEGKASRYEWAQAILSCSQLYADGEVPQLLPAMASDFPSLAVRPANSALDSRRFAKTFGTALPAWQESLKESLRP
ncbi:MAG: dTDP-4-dehydrorhamnose reductase [Anaerolineales bacterium]|nr:dTDP-4-dehydrorhamnose reductase [Anaerolineales bacterium]